MEPRRLRIKVHPGASRDAIVEHEQDRFEAWITAKPIEGRANTALLGLVSRYFHVSARRLRLVQGAAGRHKTVLVSPGS